LTRPTPLVFGLRPGVVGVEGADRVGDGFGFWAEVFLIDLALLVDKEGHDAGIAPFGGPGDEGEAGDHVAVDDVVVFAAGGVLALAREDFEVVTVERCGRVGQGFVFAAVAFEAGLGDERAEWALFVRIARGPVEAVVGALVAAEALGLFEDAVAVTIFAAVFALGVHIGPANVNGADFVATDAAVENFFFASVDIEDPGIVCFDQRDWKWPGVRADLQSFA
jgi:hypothetical protein